MFSAQELADMIRDVLLAHDECARTPDKAFRRFDGQTPYGVHPVFCAMLFLQEENLPEDVRMDGTMALLCHDIPEDTTAPLPDWCTSTARELVSALTFQEGQRSLFTMWKQDDGDARLLKFYDYVANLLASNCLTSEGRREREIFLRKVALPWMEKYHPDLEIVKMAKGLLG